MTNSDKVIVVDSNQYDEMMSVKWCYHHTQGRAYKTSVPYMGVPEFLFGKPPDNLQWDHINGNKLDNRRENLRYATNSQNNANREKQAGLYSSQYKGVFWNAQKGKWQSRLKIDGKQKHLGFFVNEKDAARAYNEAALKYFGEFAVLNEIGVE